MLNTLSSTKHDTLIKIIFSTFLNHSSLVHPSIPVLSAAPCSQTPSEVLATVNIAVFALTYYL